MKINAQTWQALSRFATTRFLGVDYPGIKLRRQHGLMLIDSWSYANG